MQSMRRVSRLATLIGCLAGSALAGAATTASAAEVDLSPVINANLSNYWNGYVYPANGGTQTIGGVAFNLAPYPNGGTGIVQANDDHPDSYTIAVNQADVGVVYTIANSAFGVYGSTIGSLTFAGSGGATYTYDYTEGLNIRDHATTAFNDVATGLYASQDYGQGDHLDVQQIVLPSAFSTQTLDSITFTGLNPDGGDPFLAAITTGGVPEPATWAMMLMGVGLIGTVLRMAQRKTAAALTSA